MKLNIGERIALIGVIPQKANILVIRRADELIKKLSLTDKEIKKYEVKASENRLTWNDPNYEIEIEIGEIMFEEIKKVLKELSEKNELTREHISLFDKFVEPKEIKKNE